MEKIAAIMPTMLCQMDCEFCINETTMQTFTPEDVEKIKVILKADQFKNIIVGGGEPLMWKYGVFNFIKEIKTQENLIQIGTNGILLNEDFYNNEMVSRWIFPIESLVATTHNQMRISKVDHHFIILKRIKALQNKTNSLTLSTVITKRNKNDVFELAEYLRKFHENGLAPIHAWHLYQFIPKGRGGEFSRDILLLEDDTYESICNEVIQLKLPFKVYKRKNMQNSKTVIFFWKEDNEIKRSADI